MVTNIYKYSVCIKCKTFNHTPYIQEAMNGFSIQKTDFPFIAVVVDDASTDGNQNVILDYFKKHFYTEEKGVSWSREDDYAHYYFARHRENHNCFFAILLLKRNQFGNPSKEEHIKEWASESKYIAICEGDDYWTDPLKLQKQVDFLENNPDYVMCFHRVQVVAEEGIVSHFFKHLEERDFSAREIYEKWTVPTCSSMFRSGVIDNTNNPGFIVYGDIYLWLRLAEIGKIHCLGFTGGVYRRNSNGVSVKWSLERYKNLYRQYVYFEKRFPALKDIAKRDQNNALEGIIYAPYFKGIWRYRFKYMFRHPGLFFSSFFTTTILSYTPIRFLKKKYRRGDS